MILKICVNENCVSYIIPDEYKNYANNILELIRKGHYTKAGLHIYSLMKRSRKI